MFIDRGMDEKDTVHIYNGILVSHKKEWNLCHLQRLGGPKDCHTEWSKSEREKQISYINVYMWNLENWYRWTHLQSRKRDIGIENKYMDTKGERRGRMECKIGIGIYTLRIKQITNEDSTVQETLLNALLWPKRQGNPPKRRYMYMCGKFTLLYSRN